MKKYAVCTLLLLGILAAVACGDGPTPVTCKDIPAGGCPDDNGVACQDPTCNTTYLCNLANGAWEVAEVCPPREAGALDAALDGDADAAPDTSLPRFDASFIDAPPGYNGGPECDGLEQPDCPLGDILACPSGCCNCEDLFYCQNGGWNHWGYCDDTGIHQDKP